MARQTAYLTKKISQMTSYPIGDVRALEAHLAEITAKIDVLKFISQNLTGASIEILPTFTDGTTIVMDQELIPFNLVMEIKTLIDDSIDEYQRTYKNLQFTLNK